MIETLYSTGMLNSPQGFLLALLIGVAFGFALEQAGFGSSRRLAGIFYFRDMTVLKVMFSGMVTAMLGLSYLVAAGWVALDTVYLMPTKYGAQIVGGLVFGIGFVMSGWCPGTAAVGFASGKLDALVALGGAVIGSILFNEVYPAVEPLMASSGVSFVYDSLSMSYAGFALALTVVAVGAFWGVEYLERSRQTGGRLFNTTFLRTFSTALVVLAAGLFLVPSPTLAERPAPERVMAESDPVDTASGWTGSLLADIESAADHIEPEELAERMMRQEPGLLVVDVRPAAAYAQFHLRNAVNVALSDLPVFLQPYKNRGLVILYSNGMTHPAQARDALARDGYQNVYILTDGLTGFIDRCLKPVSLRAEPLPDALAKQVRQWRAYFLGGDAPAPQTATDPLLAERQWPGIVDTAWLDAHLGQDRVRIVDLRKQPAYNSGHIHGAVHLHVERLRGTLDGVPSMLLPPDMLASHLGLLGIQPEDVVILVSDERVHDATLAALALERVGHRAFAILDGGYGKWVAEQRPVNTDLPRVVRSDYIPRPDARRFAVSAADLIRIAQEGKARVLDARPAEYYAGVTSDEARAGHIPQALNRPSADDLREGASYAAFRSPTELEAAYASLLPSKSDPVVVHCRTGHRASQTYFVLKHLLGYEDVSWYDGSWTEWATRADLPVVSNTPPSRDTANTSPDADMTRLGAQ
jgi:thiosulfate/3-mercaptopyruvate sulfurtransferase